MFQERLIVCHNVAGKPCANITEAEALQLEAAGLGRIVRRCTGELVKLLLSTPAPEPHVVEPRFMPWRGGSQTIARVPARESDGMATTHPLFQHKLINDKGQFVALPLDNYPQG